MDSSCRRRIGDRIIRGSMFGSVAAVAAVAGWVSYWHAVEVLLRYGAESPINAHLIPLTVDGMLYSSSAVLLWCARYRIPVPWLAWCALVIGVAATLGANILHGIDRGPLAAGLAAWPAVALVFAYELAMWVLRSETGPASHEGADAGRELITRYRRLGSRAKTSDPADHERNAPDRPFRRISGNGRSR